MDREWSVSVEKNAAPDSRNQMLIAVSSSRARVSSVATSDYAANVKVVDR
ncbi:MAG: hypothetical protein OXU66_04250 [Gammaproteobacteria bacterium]|nr:hypothetical protein [Gammaproteobacteria bacterium]